jgi:hypothetical protein
MEGSLVAYKVFTNGSVLPASDVNTYLMDQSTAVFSSSATRAASITSPVEGQLTYLEDVDLYQSYNGSDWVSPFGLTLIKKQTIGSAVSSVVVSDVFSAQYDNYRILANGGVGSTEGQIELQLGSLTTAYYASLLFNTYTGSTASATGTNNGAFFGRVGAYNTSGLSMNVDVFSPFLTERSSIASIFARQVTTGYAALQAGFINSNTSVTGFTITPNAGTLTGGTIYVYGYRKS